MRRFGRTGWILIALTACLLTGCDDQRAVDQQAYRQYGINCINNGEYENAVQAFQNALGESKGKITNVELDICYYKAEAQYLAGDYEGALATYTALIEYNKDSQAYYLRGNLHFQMGDAEAASNDYSMAVSLDKNNYELYIGIYEAMSAQGRAEEGTYYLTEALKIKGDKAQDYLEKGRISLMLADSQKAMDYLQKALDKESVEANFYMGEVYDALGDSDTAQGYYKTYLDAGIASAEDLCELGERQMNNGDYATAITYFETALSLESVPNRQIILKDEAIAYENLYDFASARNVLKEYVESYPEDEAAARELVFLETR